MNNLQKVELRGLTYEQKLAFWINMYNACIMHVYDKKSRFYFYFFNSEVFMISFV